MNDSTRTLAIATTLIAGTIALPGRTGRVAAITLGGYLLHRQAQHIQATNDGAFRAALRGGQRWAELDGRLSRVEIALGWDT